MAGEIKDIWPDKPVTLVHSGKNVLNDAYPDKFRNALAASTKARGVDIILEDFIDDIPTGPITSVTTRSGKKLDADLLVSTPHPQKSSP